MGSAVTRTTAAAVLAAVGVLVAVPSCSHDSYLVVTLTSGDGDFTGVSWLDVDVRGADGVMSPTLSYGVRQPLSFGAAPGVTLSISFTPSRSGTVDLTVTARDVDRKCIGSGIKTGAAIKKGDVAPVAVQLVHQCPSDDDGGTDAATDGGVTFKGCDPASPASSCSAGQTCFVNCGTKMGMCIAGGTKGPGETCNSNNDCMPGTQCFDYSNVTGCAAGTRICLKFCAADSMCNPGGATGGTDAGASSSGGAGAAPAGAAGGGAGGAGGSPAGAAGAAGTSAGGGPGGTSGGSGGASAPIGATAADLTPSACRNPVACSSTLVTTYRTCSFSCDPRLPATTGCPAGLSCFLYRDPVTGRDNPDCGCREPTRVKTDGATCAGAYECAPGHVCNLMAGTQICRKLCKVGVAGECASPSVCQPLSGSTFGVCIPGTP